MVVTGGGCPHKVSTILQLHQLFSQETDVDSNHTSVCCMTSILQPQTHEIYEAAYPELIFGSLASQDRVAANAAQPQAYLCTRLVHGDERLSRAP